jgi:hypothetical protein
MSSHNDLPSHRVEEPTLIPRSPTIFDLSNLAHNTPRTSHQPEYRRSVSVTSADQSECYGSENSQVLYMSSPLKRSRKSRSSLSSVGNQTTRIMDGPSDTKADAEECSAAEKVAWNVIDREIFEWQYVCSTGRPYWWSLESKYNPLKRLPGRSTNEPSPQSWMRDLDDPSKKFYNRQRRAVTDGYLAGESSAEDLAHLVAVQLLSSCFTLPPDQEGLPPDFNSYNLNGRPNSPDPRLISSLKMHTHFRYSPSFGHQPRNTSPVQLWSRCYDGPSPLSSPLCTAAGLQTPIIGTSSSPPRRRRAHRPLNVTESSANWCWLENQSEDHLRTAGKDYLDPTASASAWYRRQGIDDINARPMTLPYLPSQSPARKQGPSSPQSDDDIDPERYRGVQSCPRSRSPKTNYRLQPFIRSEPHHVFVQPVKELVVKRWNRFRRRFGGSLHSHVPTDSTEFMSETSSPAHSGASSPSMSSDGRARRRRAQERGDIHSSHDSTPHYNSPVTGYGTPNDSPVPNPFWADSASPSPSYQLANPLAAAPAPALEETGLSAGSSTYPNSSTPSGSSIQHDLLVASTSASPSIASQLKVQLTSPAQSYTKTMRKKHRRSMLSEMHTPEDLAGKIASGEADQEAASRSALSAAGSALASPREVPAEAESGIDFVLRLGHYESVGNLGPGGALPMRRMSVSSETRASLRLSKTSTTGTQVFTPSDDGVEIDGLPAGPSKEYWDNHSDGRGKRRVRTYL